MATQLGGSRRRPEVVDLREDEGAKGLRISVAAGTGEGLTELAAFDRALYEAGLAHYNLVTLSSVIPAGSAVVPRRVEADGSEWGYRLDVVIAQQRTMIHGAQAWASLGWVQHPKTGAGLFVEHHGASQDEVEEQVHASLQSMQAYREMEFGSVQLMTAGITCESRPVCALVAAAYRSRDWSRAD